MEKKDIRKLVFKRREEEAEEAIRAKSLVICEKIMQMEAYRQASCIYAYMDCKKEVCLGTLFRAAWDQGKRIAVPKVFGKEMKFFYITSYEDVAPGYFGIEEPVTEEVAEEEEALMIMPGVAFDSNRHRCGYGGGFYDRYLSIHKNHKTIAPAFDFQMMEEVPADGYDIFPEIVITETKSYQ